MMVMISQPPPRYECQQRINSVCGGSGRCAATNCTAEFLNAVINGQSLLFVPVFNFTNMHAMSHRSDFCLVCSSKVNIQEPPVCFTIPYLLTVSQVELHSIQTPTAMSDWKSLNTSQLEVMISSNNERVLIREMSDHGLQIIFDV